MRSQEGEGKSAPDGAGCGGGGGGCPTCGWGALGKDMGDREGSGEGGHGVPVPQKCPFLSPAPAFLGTGKLSVAVVVIPYLGSPSYTRCFVVGLATTEGSPALGNALHPVHGRSGMFPSWQCRGRAALTQAPKRCGRVCTAVCEAAGSFTCRCRSLIMTQDLKIWNSKYGPFPL